LGAWENPAYNGLGHLAGGNRRRENELDETDSAKMNR